jgi:phosphoglycerate-specific signal transduction histidine kinase
MVVFKRKTRMISFRLSEEEYQYLRSISESEGARSVSDYARDTLFRIRQAARRPPAEIQAKMDKLASRLDSLNREVQSLRDGQPAPMNQAEVGVAAGGCDVR